MAGRRVRIDRIAHVILNLRLQYSPSSGRIPREGPFLFLSLSCRSSWLLFHFWRDHRHRRQTFSFTSGNILPISLSMQISIHERQYLLTRAEKGFWCTGILSAIERALDFRARKALRIGEKQRRRIPDEWERNRSFLPLEITIEKKETEIHEPSWMQTRFCLRYYFNGTERFQLPPRVLLALHRFRYVVGNNKKYRKNAVR